MKALTTDLTLGCSKFNYELETVVSALFTNNARLMHSERKDMI